MSKKKRHKHKFFQPTGPTNQNQSGSLVSNESNGVANGNPRPTNHIKQVIAQSYEGPMPPPGWFAEYNRVLPGAADRILTVFEKQVAHRIDVEKIVITSDTTNSKLGLKLGFFLQLVAIIAGAYIIIKGQQLAGGTIVAGAFATLLANLYGQVSKRNDSIEKKKKKHG